MTTTSPPLADQLVQRSVRRYAKHSRSYSRNHPEIFNSVEQERLQGELSRLVDDSAASPPHALDLGAGSGNVTAHLLHAGARVTAAEVSPHFIELLHDRFGDAIESVRINGVDLDVVPDATFDLVTLYSVLHHIPDYLAIVPEIARVLRPGGHVYFDHEVTEEYWRPDGCWAEYQRACQDARRRRPGPWNPDRYRWQRFLRAGGYVRALRTLRDPEYMLRREGDIHVTADDHIEWPKLARAIERSGMTVVRTTDYLNYSANAPLEVWQRYRDRGCTSMRGIVARRDPA